MKANELDKSENTDLNENNLDNQVEVSKTEIATPSDDVGSDDEKNSEVTSSEKEADTKACSESDSADASSTEEVKKDEVAKKDEPKQVLEKVDLSKLDNVGLITRLKYIFSNYDINVIKDEVEEIKGLFYSRYHQELAKLKEKFVSTGEEEGDFEPPINNEEAELSRLLGLFRTKRMEFNQKLEKEREENLAKKDEIVKKIKDLVNSQELKNETFEEFKKLRKKFYEIGQIPQAKVRDMWDTFNLHVENFYDFVKINSDLRDLDFKKNLEAKEELCKQAEDLLKEDNVKEAFRNLQVLHDKWRETGPVDKEYREAIWGRFKAATTEINKKHQDYYSQQKEKLKENAAKKIGLCEEVEVIAKENYDNIRDWNQKSKEIIAIQQRWKEIGFSFKKDDNAIYSRFRAACDVFFEAKRKFAEQFRAIQEQNLKLKEALCEQAEALKDSTEWKSTSDKLVKIQKDWKLIGAVPRKQSDAVWKRFRAACDHFFEVKKQQQSAGNAEQDNNLKLKQAIIEELKAYTPSEEKDEVFAKLQDFQNRFFEIGFVPIKVKDAVNDEFRTEINKHFDALDIDEHEKNVQRFKSRIENFKNSHDGDNKLSTERKKLQNKLKQLEGEIIVWENNLGFFSKSKSAEKMLKEYQRKIENAKKSIGLLKDKIRLMRNS